MKFTKLLAAAALAALTFFTSCQQKEEQLGDASISASPSSMEFVASDAPSQPVTLKATRKWRVESKPEWVVLDKEEGNASSSAQTVVVSVEDNDGFNRSGDVVFSIGIRKAAVHVVQAGDAGELVASGKGTVESPFNVLGAIAYVDSLGADVASEVEVYIKGKVSQIEEAFSFSYGNGTFFITDDGTVDTPKFYIFRVKYINNAAWTIKNPQIAKGDEVVVCSKVVNYKGNTPETVMLGSKQTGGPYNGYLYSINGSTEAQETIPDFSDRPKKTVAEFIAAANENEFFILSGAVSNFNASYCSFDLTDKTGSIYVYSVANPDEWKTQINNKDTVTLAGAYAVYKKTGEPDKHEVVSAWIMEKKDAPQQTVFEDKTVAEFITLADTVVAYRLSGLVSSFVKGKNKQNVEYMQFDLTDGSKIDGVEAKVLVYGFKAGQYEEWNEKISNGGTVTLHGLYQPYVKDGVTTHEVMDAYIEEFEAAPVIEEEAEGDGTLATPYNVLGVMGFIDADDFNTSGKDKDVYVTGKISQIVTPFSTTADAVFWISSTGAVSPNQFEAYRVKYLGNKAWQAGQRALEVGDEVVLYGKVTKYQSTYETSSGKAYIYSINGKTEDDSPVLGVASKAISVAYNATSATVSVTGNVHWTAAGTGCTVAPAEGDNEGEITVSFAANTEETAKTYKVVISTTASVAENNIEVTITQAAKPAAGQPVIIDLDFTQSAPSADFPVDSANGKKDGTYTFGGYKVVFHAASSFYWNSKDKYILIGKANSYIELPAIDEMKLTKVEFLTGANASENVIIDIYKGSTALKINTEKIKKGTTYNWDIAAGEVGVSYRIYVTNAYNAQFQKIKLTYSPAE